MSPILWEPPVPNRPRFWARQFALAPTRAQDTYDAIFGVILPVLCFIIDPVVFNGGFGGRPILQDYQLVAYLISTVEMGLFLVWRTFRTRLSWLSPMFAGAFFAGAAFSAAIGVVLLPFTLLGLIFLIGVLGFIPFVTAFVYLRTGIRALKTPRTDVGLGTTLSAAVFGAVMVIALPNLASVRFEQEVSASVQSLVYGDAAHAEAAAQRLKRLRMIPTKYRNQLAGAYSDEHDPVKKEILKRTYLEITGEDLEVRQQMLAD